jgi:hypothetical protein
VLLQLPGRHSAHLLAVGVADLRAEQARETVDVTVAVRVEDVGALTAFDNEQFGAAGAEVAVPREVQKRRTLRDRSCMSAHSMPPFCSPAI